MTTTSSHLPSGAFALLKAYPMLLQKGVRRYAFAPVLVNILIFTVALYFLGGFGSYLETQYMQIISGLGVFTDLLEWLAFLIKPILYISFSIIFFYFFSTLTQIIAAPFNAILSEKIEQQLGLAKAADETNISFMQALKQALPRELYKLWKSLKWLLLMLILLFIPGLNFLSPLIGAWLLAIDYLDYPADNRGLNFKQSLALSQQKPLGHLFFGLTVYIACLIPIVNFFVVPAAICAGTMLWHQLDRSKIHSDQTALTKK